MDKKHNKSIQWPAMDPLAACCLHGLHFVQRVTEAKEANHSRLFQFYCDVLSSSGSTFQQLLLTSAMSLNHSFLEF